MKWEFVDAQEKKVIITLKGSEIQSLKEDLIALQRIKSLRSDTKRLLNALVRGF